MRNLYLFLVVTAVVVTCEPQRSNNDIIWYPVDDEDGVFISIYGEKYRTTPKLIYRSQRRARFSGNEPFSEYGDPTENKDPSFFHNIHERRIKSIASVPFGLQQHYPKNPFFNGRVPQPQKYQNEESNNFQDIINEVFDINKQPGGGFPIQDGNFNLNRPGNTNANQWSNSNNNNQWSNNNKNNPNNWNSANGNQWGSGNNNNNPNQWGSLNGNQWSSSTSTSSSGSSSGSSINNPNQWGSTNGNQWSGGSNNNNPNQWGTTNGNQWSGSNNNNNNPNQWGTTNGNQWSSSSNNNNNQNQWGNTNQNQWQGGSNPRPIEKPTNSEWFITEKPSKPNNQNRPNRPNNNIPSRPNKPNNPNRKTTTTSTTDADKLVFPDETPVTPPSRKTTTTSQNTPVDPPTLSPCELTCPATPEFNPVCGTDSVSYTNSGRLKCAKLCGKDVEISHYGNCGKTKLTTPLLSDTFREKRKQFGRRDWN